MLASKNMPLEEAVPKMQLRITASRILLKEALLLHKLNIPLKANMENGLGKSTKKSWKPLTLLLSTPKRL